jgi:PadR family transcriptional regulator PadR
LGQDGGDDASALEIAQDAPPRPGQHRLDVLLPQRRRRMKRELPVASRRINAVERRTAASQRILLGQGSLYPALRKLEREGRVKSREADPTPERGGRPRVYYKLTAAGQRAAKDDWYMVAGLYG